MWTLSPNIFSKPQPSYYNQILPLDIIVSCYRANQSVAKWWENYRPENPRFCPNFLIRQQPTISPEYHHRHSCFNNLLHIWSHCDVDLNVEYFIVFFISDGYKVIYLTSPESKELHWHRPQSDSTETLNKINKTFFWPDSGIAFLPGPILVNYGWTEDSFRTEGQKTSQPYRDCGASKEESLSKISRLRWITNNICFEDRKDSTVCPERASTCSLRREISEICYWQFRRLLNIQLSHSEIPS